MQNSTIRPEELIKHLQSNGAVKKQLNRKVQKTWHPFSRWMPVHSFIQANVKLAAHETVRTLQFYFNVFGDFQLLVPKPGQHYMPPLSVNEFAGHKSSLIRLSNSICLAASLWDAKTIQMIMQSLHT